MADYVVTRKRKRYAVDPCLGYYMSAPSSDGGVESAAGACSNLANERVAHAANDSVPQLMKGSCKSGDKTMQGNPNRPSQDSQCSRAQLKEEDVLTVEAFLKCSAKEKTKTYRHKKLLNRQVNDRKSDAGTKKATRSSTTPRRSSTGNNGTDKNFGSGSDSKNTRRRKNRKPLKERLYEAAILTHGNPDEYYTRSEAAEGMASNRTALLFVPYEHASRDRVAGKTHTKALVVDPRKSMAMQTASFTWRPLRRYTDNGLLSNTLDRIPLSKWNLTLNDKSVGVPTNRKESKMTADMATDYPPLKFVSFQEAENNYRTLFPGAGRTGLLKPHSLTDIASPLEGANHKTDAHDCSSQSKRPSTAVSGIIPGVPAIHRRVHLTTATSQQASLASANAMRNVDIDGHLPGTPRSTVVLPHNSVSGESSASGRAKERLPLTPLKDSSSSLESALWSQISDIQNNMTSNGKTRYKPLRPLGSFVNELLKRNSKA